MTASDAVRSNPLDGDPSSAGIVRPPGLSDYDAPRVARVTQPRRLALAMTGASGAPYGLRLLECLLAAGVSVDLMLSNPGRVVLGMETPLRVPANPSAATRQLSEQFAAGPEQLRVWGAEQWTAPVASGSGFADAMVVCPCSMASVSAIAVGASRGLIERAADVALKERRDLILVVRETPFSAIHLENLLKLARLGVCVMPANPAFYHAPTNIAELVDFIVARVLDQLDLKHELTARWGRDDSPQESASTPVDALREAGSHNPNEHEYASPSDRSDRDDDRAAHHERRLHNAENPP